MSAIAVGVAVAGGVAAAATTAALRPKAPKPGAFTPIDQQAEQRSAIAGNEAAFTDISALATRTNTFSAAEVQRMYELAIPGYNKLAGKAGGVIDLFLSGGDITDTLRGTAAANLSRGVAGSGFGRTTALKNAVTATQTNKLTGIGSLERWMATTKSPMFDFSSMFVNPNPQFAASERDKALTYENASERYNFVNDPWNEFQYKAADIFGNTVKNYLSASGPGSTQGNIDRWRADNFTANTNTSSAAGWTLGADGFLH